MKKKIICVFLSGVLFIIGCTYPGEKKCSKLKRGEFYYKGKVPLTGNIIKRDDSMQIVTDEKTGEKLKEKIVWIEPCAYMLYPFPGNKADILNSDLFPIEVDILDVAKEYYTVHVCSGNNKTNFNDTAWIVR